MPCFFIYKYCGLLFKLIPTSKVDHVGCCGVVACHSITQKKRKCALGVKSREGKAFERCLCFSVYLPPCNSTLSAFPVAPISLHATFAIRPELGCNCGGWALGSLRCVSEVSVSRMGQIEIGPNLATLSEVGVHQRWPWVLTPQPGPEGGSRVHRPLWREAPGFTHHFRSERPSQNRTRVLQRGFCLGNYLQFCWWSFLSYQWDHITFSVCFLWKLNDLKVKGLRTANGFMLCLADWMINFKNVLKVWLLLYVQPGRNDLWRN